MRRAGSCTTLSFAVGEAALEHTESTDKTLNPQDHNARESWPRPENNSNSQGADTARHNGGSSWTVCTTP